MTEKMKINRFQVLMQVQQVRNTIQKMEQTALKLLAHPDATPEQIEEVHRCMVDMNKRRHEANNKLLVAFPSKLDERFRLK